MKNRILTKIDGEPVLAFALIQALLGAVVAFGLNLTSAQNVAVLTVTGAVLAIVCRGRVSPVATKAPRDEVGESGVSLALLIAILLVVVLFWFGVRP